MVLNFPSRINSYLGNLNHSCRYMFFDRTHNEEKPKPKAFFEEGHEWQEVCGDLTFYELDLNLRFDILLIQFCRHEFL